MAQFEHGIYRPSDEIRAFDGGLDSEAVEEGSRLPLLIVIALLVFFAFGGVVWLAYNQGVKHGREDTPQVIAVEQTRSKASSAALAPADSYANLGIYRQPKSAKEDLASSNRVAPATATAASPPAASGKKAASAPSATSGALANRAPVQAAAKPRSQSAQRTAVKESVVPPHTEKMPGTQAVASHLPKTIVAAALQPGSARVQPETKVAAVPTHPSGIAANKDAAPPGAFVLQIGAYRSEADALASWRTYKSAHVAAAGYAPDIKRVELPGKGAWYRLRIGTFADAAAADALCAKLKASGGACFSAKP